MRSVFDHHRLLRRQVKRLGLIDSLYVIRAYEQHLQFNNPFPHDVEVADYFLKATNRYDKKVFEWELDILTRELFIWASDLSTISLCSWDEFARCINYIKELGNKIAETYPEVYKPNILIELYRIAHNQFPWQRGTTRDAVLRYFKIFGASQFDPILQSRIGLTASELYIIGLALVGHFSEEFLLKLPMRVEGLAVSPEQIDLFVSLFSADIPTLRRNALEDQVYDHDYEYAFNPLRKFPLVRIIESDRVISVAAPFPTFLLRRFTEGIYYDLWDAKGFSDAFGSSFQTYAGEVISAANFQNKLTVVQERSFDLGKNRKDTVDWIVSDGTADLFVECKTKRIRREAKISLANPEALSVDLDKMADFVVQVYKTLIDALNGMYPHWIDEGKPIYVMILTLEEWFAFGDRLTPAVDEAILAKLNLAGIDPQMLVKYPYTICGIEDFEIAIQIMCSRGIDAVMSGKTNGGRRLWPMLPYLHTLADGDIRIVEELFPNDWRRIHPGIGSLGSPD